MLFFYFNLNQGVLGTSYVMTKCNMAPMACRGKQESAGHAAAVGPQGESCQILKYIEKHSIGTTAHRILMSAAASARGCRAGRGPCGAMADGREKALPFLGNDEGTYRGQMSSLLQILAYYYVLDARTRHVRSGN